MGDSHRPSLQKSMWHAQNHVPDAHPLLRLISGAHGLPRMQLGYLPAFLSLVGSGFLLQIQCLLLGQVVEELQEPKESPQRCSL